MNKDCPTSNPSLKGGGKGWGGDSWGKGGKSKGYGQPWNKGGWNKGGKSKGNKGGGKNKGNSKGAYSLDSMWTPPTWDNDWGYEDWSYSGMSSLGMIGRANGKNNNRYAPLSDDSAKPDEVSNGSNVGVTALVAGKLIEIPTSIERDGEVYTVVPYKKTKFANVAPMQPHGKSNKKKPRKAPPCV